MAKRADVMTPKSGQPLDRDRIVQASLEIILSDGIDGLTMRSLAQSLDVSGMAVYHYVEGKAELLSIVADHVVGLVDTDFPEGLSWDERLLLLQERLMETVVKYPGIDLVITSASRLTPNIRRCLEVALGILREAGFDDRTALLAYSALHTYTFGRLCIIGRLRGHHSDPNEKPRPTEIAGLHGADFTRFGLRVTIEGLHVMRDDFLRSEASSVPS